LLYKGGIKLSKDTIIIFKNKIGCHISAVEVSSDKMSPAWQQARLYGIDPKNNETKNVLIGIYKSGAAKLRSLKMNLN
jgi:hypothetical protein